MLAELEQPERKYKRGALVRREHDPVRELLIVQQGWLHSYLILDNGSRQITGLHHPGDVAAMSALAFERTGPAIVSVTDAVVSPVEKAKIGRLFAEHPRIAGLLFAIAVAERASVADRMAAIGRTSARSRVALILCEMFSRLRAIAGGSLAEFQIPLTQEDIGDTIGLTAVHVNRMMRELVDDRVIERSGSTVRILEEERLAAEANFIDRYAKIDTSWLPEPRE
jgi:CRP-like cAMP-binding protein